jgi:hypothetical protein
MWFAWVEVTMGESGKNSDLKRIVRPSPTVAVSALALLITLSSIAGALPGKNTVDSGDVKPNSLKGKDLKESTLKLPAAAVAGGLKISVYRQSAGSINPGFPRGATAACPAGKEAIAGGGADLAGLTPQGDMTDSRPSQGPAGTAAGPVVNDGQSFTAWRAHWYNQNPGASPITPVTYVVCVG